MERRQVGWFAAFAMLTLLAAFSAPAFPMTQTGTDAEAAIAPPSEAESVEAILKRQEELLRGERFSYEPGNRRDPFATLFSGEPQLKAKGPRPRGIAGMLVSEIDLAGIVRDPQRGDVGFFTGSDNKGYFLRVGERVYDATVIAIDADKGSVTFRQQTDDPRQIKPYRDVVRRLEPLEETANE
jgi:hypothetical protein